MAVLERLRRFATSLWTQAGLFAVGTMGLYVFAFPWLTVPFGTLPRDAVFLWATVPFVVVATVDLKTTFEAVRAYDEYEAWSLRERAAAFAKEGAESHWLGHLALMPVGMGGLSCWVVLANGCGAVARWLGLALSGASFLIVGETRVVRRWADDPRP